MNKLLVVSAVLASLAASAHAKDRWYIARSGAETCFPLDDLPAIGDHKRFYYGLGPYHEPEEFAAALRQLDADIRLIPGTPPGIVEYHHLSDGKGVTYVFFNNQALCRNYMARVEDLR